jgi:hypothetical protein
MSFVAAAVVGGSALAGAALQSSAAQSAASAQANQANQAMGYQQQQYNQARNDLAPYRQAGTQALSQLQSQMPDLTRSFSAADFQADPGYQFNLQQGQNAIQRSAAARGLLNSTGTMKNLAGFTSGLASNEYSNAYNRFTQNQNQRYNMLSSLASGGQGAIGQTNAAGMNAANNMSNTAVGLGNAQAASQIGQANAIGGALNTGANSFMNMSALSRLNPSTTTTYNQNQLNSDTSNWMRSPSTGVAPPSVADQSTYNWMTAT